jgi:dipeptidyl aminopeptidase/acylaminoacyl peptidase
MRRLALVLAFGASLLTVVWALQPESTLASEEQQRPELISIRDFFANPNERWSYKLSPDGKRLGWIGSYEGHPTVFFRKLGSDEVHAIRTERDIWDFWWVSDSRRIFFSWDEQGDENWHLWMADTDDPSMPYVDLTPWPGRTARVHQVFRDDPAHILIKDNRRDVRIFDLYRMNIDTGETRLLFENPGDVQAWITNPTGEMLGRIRADRGWSLELWRAADRRWEPRFGGEAGDDFRIVGRPLGVRRVWALSNRGRDRTALVQVDLESGEEQIVFADPEVDVDDAWADPDSYALRSVSYSPGSLQTRYFDQKLERAVEGVRAGRRANAWVTGLSRDERMWTVALSSDTEGTSYHLFDSQTGERTLLSEADIARYRDRLSPMQPIAFTARDGLRIHGYLTLPKGSEAARLPLVLDVHGGPWWRWRWGFNHAAQFLSNRGYAVLQINYRGSTGYGRRFMEAAIGEFGGRMQEDLLDAVAWAVAEGIADPARVAIYGWDYGGYAVLEALTSTPKVFAAGVAASAPADWVASLEQMPPYWAEHAARYHRYLGNPADPEQRPSLRARSPIHRLDQLVRPLLVIQGERDIRGMTEQAQAVVTALRRGGRPVEYLGFPDEGHWIQNWQNNVRLYRSLENFLGAHLGGRRSPLDAIELWLGLQ